MPLISRFSRSLTSIDNKMEAYPDQHYIEDDDPSLQYVRHLYVSMGLIAARETTITRLKEEFAHNTSTRVTQLLTWIDEQRLFTERRNAELQRGQGQVVSDNQILLEAWHLLANVVSRGLYPLLRRMWRMLATVGVREDEHTAYSWHLAAILYYWVQEGIHTGAIPIREEEPPQTPYRLVSQDESSDDAGDTVMINICRHLASLRCYLNLTSSTGDAIVRRRSAELAMPAYLYRLSATKPGVIVLQYYAPGDRSTRNVRLGVEVFGASYNFYWSSRDYKLASESLINKQTQKRWPQMVPLYPSVREMMGLTGDYLDYFGDSVSRGGGISLNATMLLSQ